jgi:hypothetical protein
MIQPLRKSFEATKIRDLNQTQFCRGTCGRTNKAVQVEKWQFQKESTLTHDPVRDVRTMASKASH